MVTKHKLYKIGHRLKNLFLWIWVIFLFLKIFYNIKINIAVKIIKLPRSFRQHMRYTHDNIQWTIIYCDENKTRDSY